jgi:membrane-bound lytic murein transglycosylase C
MDKKMIQHPLTITRFALRFASRFAIVALAITLTSCSTTEQSRIAKAILSDSPKAALEKYVLSKSKQYAESPGQLISDIKSFSQLVSDLKAATQVLWGEKDATIASNKKYVKYTNDYQSKAEVDFVSGFIKVQTIASDKPLAQLKEAIVTTLLTNDNPANTDIFSAKTPKLTGKPYLLNQVLDQDKKPIAYAWRANRFADYLIKNQLKKQTVGKHLSHYVQIAMVKSHTQLRQKQYAEHVLAAANRYQIKPDLIYAIIETESSFNPFAVSHANAYGLMQIVPSTAGKDVYEKIHKRSGVPTEKTLFTPKDNIDIGTAYLHILQNNYLNKINDHQSRHFAMISAYNGGAGNVFKTFSQSRSNASGVINRLSPAHVYEQLTHQHPRAESRRYLEKVTKAEQHYQ